MVLPRQPTCSFGVDHSLRNTLTIKMRQCVQKCEILHLNNSCISSISIIIFLLCKTFILFYWQYFMRFFLESFLLPFITCPSYFFMLSHKFFPLIMYFTCKGMGPLSPIVMVQSPWSTGHPWLVVNRSGTCLECKMHEKIITREYKNVLISTFSLSKSDRC